MAKHCGICGCIVTDENRGKWSPYFCQSCDKKRVEHVSRQMDEIAAKMKEGKA